MLKITFEFVGGPNDGRVEQGRFGESNEAVRHYLLSHHGRVGQRFSVAADYTIEVLSGDAKDVGHTVQRHHYVVTERSQDGNKVWVRAEYVPQHKKTSQAAAQPKSWLDGTLLVASPRLKDHFLAQAVVLIMHHDDEEALGVILNRLTSETVGEFWRQVSDDPCACDQPVHLGGPADGPVIALHTEPRSDEEAVAPGVFLAVDRDELDELVRDEQAEFRLLVGTARWESSQLAQELDAGVWLKLPATTALIFEEPADAWRQALREYGRTFLDSVGVRDLPEDPTVN
ncbi:MAG: YqgE/AlgH family protein [Pirellulaceae bacterium]